MVSDTDRWNLLQRKTQQTKAVRATKLFRSAGIEPILIKGEAAAQFYPNDKIRISTDIDLAVADHDFENADHLCRSEAAAGLAIDLHRGLRHLDTVEWQDLFENSVHIAFDDGSIRVLRAEDNLRVLCVHWLTDGGVFKDRLWDIYHAVTNRSPNFDWDRFLGVVSKKRRRWLICTLGLTHRYLGLDLSDTPVRKDAEQLPKWLIKAVELEWTSEIKPRPLEASLEDSQELMLQVKRRFNPNPIRATVEMEGSFDSRTRFFYKLGNFVMRIPSSYRRVYGTLRAK